MGGFECATHRRRDGFRVDSIARSGHDAHAAADIGLLRSLGIRTIREGLRWHLIERVAGEYDFSSATSQALAAKQCGVEVIWDLCHWGYPDHLDPLAEAFPVHLARYAAAAANWLRSIGGPVAGWVPVNEMSFWADIGGQHGEFAPHARGQGDLLKMRLTQAHVAAAAALREAGHAQPLIVCEPLIHIAAPPDSPPRAAVATRQRDAAWDAVRWILRQAPWAIDVIGANYYPHNQWAVGSRRTLAMHDPRRRRLSDLLADAHAAFGLPLLLAETGDEEPAGEGWMREVQAEAAAAMQSGVPLLGVCIYPAADYRGWDNARRCPCGPIEMRGGERRLRPAYAGIVARLERLGAARILHADAA
jgi:hypothetical protein